jgi:transcriptional regulator with XRE-family HTH domain
MEVQQALAHRLRRRRMALGLTLTQLSEQTQIPLQVLSRLEHGHQSIYVERLADLARFLGVSADFLLGLSDKEQIIG